MKAVPVAVAVAVAGLAGLVRAQPAATSAVSVAGAPARSRDKASKAKPHPKAAPGVTLIDRRYLTDIPRTSQTFEGAIGAAPGAQNDGYGVAFGGASSFENRYDVDGLDTSGMVFGTPGAHVPDELVDHIAIAAAGAGPALGGAEGAFVVVTTPHGTNHVHGEVYASFAPAALVGAAEAVQTAPSTIAVASAPGDTVDLAAAVGGPIVRDRAWFFVGVAPELAHTDHLRTISRRTDCHVVQDGALSPCQATYADGIADVDPHTGQFVVEPVDSELRTDTADATTLLGRIDVAPAPGQQGSLTVLATPSTSTSPGLVGLASSGWRSWGLTTDVAARWNATLAGGALSLDAGLGWHRARYDTGSIDPRFDATPQQLLHGGDLSHLAALGGESIATLRGCHDGGPNDPYPGIVNCPVDAYAIGGPGDELHDFEDRRTAHVAATARLHAAGLHAVTVGASGELDAEQQLAIASGGAFIDNFDGDAEILRNVQLAPPGVADPAFDHLCTEPAGDAVPCRYLTDGSGIDAAAHALSGAAYVEDRWHPARGLVVDLGLRASKQRLDTPDDAQVLGLGRRFLDFPVQLEPRIGASYDPTGEGRARLFVHWGRYGETVLMNLERVAGASVATDDQFGFGSCGPVDPRLGVPDGTGCLGKTTGFEQTFESARLAVAPGIQPGYLDELVAGGQIEARPDLVLGATLVDRRLGRALEDVWTGQRQVIANPGHGSDAAVAALIPHTASTTRWS